MGEEGRDGTHASKCPTAIHQLLSVVHYREHGLFKLLCKMHGHLIRGFVNDGEYIQATIRRLLDLECP